MSLRSAWRSWRGELGGLVLTLTEPKPYELTEKEKGLVVNVEQGIIVSESRNRVYGNVVYEDGVVAYRPPPRTGYASIVTSYSPLERFMDERVEFSNMAYTQVDSIIDEPYQVAVSMSPDDYDAFKAWKESQSNPEPATIEPKKLRLIDLE